jgi:hypothetical protein
VRRKLPRRDFLKNIGGAAFAGAISRPLRATVAEDLQTQKPVSARVAVFWEPGFPTVSGCDLTQAELQKSLENIEVKYLSEQALIERLNTGDFDLLVTPYGSAFPKRAWRTLLQYFLKGGNWLNLGGVPLAAPVVRKNDQWRVETHQTAYHKRLGVTQSFPVKAESIASYEAKYFFKGQIENEIRPREVYELYVRFTSSSYFEDEAGSDGPREAALQTLIFGVNQQQRRIAAPVIQIDRLQGDFAGGRWVFANFSGGISPGVIRVLARCATEGAIQFLVRSDFACYRETETPKFAIHVHRPKGDLDKMIGRDCRIEVHNLSNQIVSQQSISLSKENSQATGAVTLGNEVKLTPGFYYVHARQNFNSTMNGSVDELSYLTGFWVYDDALMRSSKPFTVDNHFLYHEGKVLPVTGTTYMASDVHRQFLFDPNPLVWDQDFRAMKAAGVNMVRTGIWTGWKKYMAADGKVNEAVLRAFDAFLLTARKYDIPVIFTFFAFLPETWGGKNAYLDPRAVQAQQQFISTFAQRYREVDDLIWDLINEPSFCSPKHLWSCRPNYDEFEKAAWHAWLKERYPVESEEARLAKLQELWRTTGDDSLDLPRLEDFEGRHIFDGRYPLKTVDYRLFAQDMFARWVRAMTAAIRSNGNPTQLITVGQDEAGLGDSPNNQFFAGSVDFASLHNWWNNDDLVWDNVVAKPPAKANLVEETGVMFYEKADGTAWRTEEEARNLLERKMAISLGADGAGFIQWIWNANCYINSDNEAAIGFHRVDQTAKPELEPFLDIAKFYSTHSQLLHDLQDPRVLMVIPHSQMFSPRNFATEATRRCVRAMYYHCRTPLRAVTEHAFAETSANPKLIVVPSPRALTRQCWEALLKRAEQGGTVAITGVLDSDDHWLPVERSERFGWIAETKPVSESEFINIAGRQHLVRYEGEKIQRIEKAVVDSVNPAKVLSRALGAGRFIWSPLPLEPGDSIEAVAAFYRLALSQAGVFPKFRLAPDTPALLVLPSIFENVMLYTLVSEADQDIPVTLIHLEAQTRFTLTVPAERTALLLIDRKSGRLIASTLPVR